MADPTYDGFTIGTAARVVHSPLPNMAQEDSYFGITGVVRIDGGGRGRVFYVSGVFIGDDLPTVLAYESTLLSYADGVAREFTDTMGRAWPNTVFSGEYRPGHPLPLAGGGWSMQFEAVFRTLS